MSDDGKYTRDRVRRSPKVRARGNGGLRHRRVEFENGPSLHPGRKRVVDAQPPTANDGVIASPYDGSAGSFLNRTVCRLYSYIEHEPYENVTDSKIPFDIYTVVQIAHFISHRPVFFFMYPRLYCTFEPATRSPRRVANVRVNAHVFCRRV